MSDTITVTGLVATTPRHLVTSEGLPITSFRVASTQRRFDRSQEKWIDAETNWYTVSVFRQLAINAAASIKKGERVLVTGRLRIREWQNGERAGTTIEIEADAIGHDLSWGTSVFGRTISSSESSSNTESSSTESVPQGDETPTELSVQIDAVQIEEPVSVPF
jgi:single-strand DNA-binding protein